MHPIENGRFRFACHQGLPCFTVCCAKLNLVLTPYDVMRLRRRLNVSSRDFLRRYTTSYVEDGSGLPVVKLRMNEDEGRRCPFVTPGGCSVYEDRPAACRLYPVGRAASKMRAGDKSGEYYFLIKERHCLGFNEEREWTIQEWVEDQGLGEHNSAYEILMDISAGESAKAVKALNDKQLQMYFMACYSLDEFKKFVFSTTFLDRFVVDQQEIEKIEIDDLELFKFACRWLQFSLFGKRTIALRDKAQR
jgi:Fe-S-cluster containining protein